MPVSSLTDAERNRLGGFPCDIATEDLFRPTRNVCNSWLSRGWREILICGILLNLTNIIATLAQGGGAGETR